MFIFFYFLKSTTILIYMAVPLLAKPMHAFLGDFFKPYTNEDMTIIRIYEFSTKNNFCPVVKIVTKKDGGRRAEDEGRKTLF